MQGVVTCCIVSCLLLAACARRGAPENSQKSEGQKLTSDLSVFKAFHGQEQVIKDQQKKIAVAGYYEARMLDVPIPVGSSIVQDSPDDDVCMFVTARSIEELLVFYRRELERAGWQEQVVFTGAKTMAIFKKPNRWLAISMQQQDSWWGNDEKNKVIIHQQQINKAT